jgi:sugar phosphate isomerase/epimerase
MAKKIAIGTWAYAFGPYEKNPVPFDTVCRTLGQMGMDGIEIAAFRPHVHPEDYPMKADREKIRNLIRVNNLGVAGMAADFWATPGPGTKEGAKEDFYLKLFKKNLQLALDLGSPAIRVDTVQPPDVLEGKEREQCRKRIVRQWKRCAQAAEDAGIRMVWEFEPGFIFNKPSEVVQMVEEVNHPNFKVMFDTCHAYMCAVVGARQHGRKETLRGGVAAFARKLKGQIGHVHLIDSDGTLHGDETSTHRPFGEGKIDFDKAIPAIVEDAGYHSEWWSIDLCFWPEAWEVTENALKFLRPYAEKY